MYYIGVDLGGTNIVVGIVDAEGNIISKKSVKTYAQRPFDQIVADMAACVNDLLGSAGIGLDDIKSIGIGSPGTLDTQTGVMVYANNFLHGTNVPLRDLMRRHIDKPVYLGNDANAAALGEVICGAAKGCKDVVMVTLGTGVGGGIVIDGKIYEGQYSAGAELGHIMLIKDGEKCSCGRYGCWEAYASATALVRQTRRAMETDPDSLMNSISSLNSVNGRTAFIAAAQGDRTAQRVVDNYIEYVSDGLIDIVNIFRPEVIIMGGGICNEGENLLSPLRKRVNRFKYAGGLLPDQRIEAAKLGNDAGLIGAALLVR